MASRVASTTASRSMPARTLASSPKSSISWTSSAVPMNRPLTWSCGSVETQLLAVSIASRSLGALDVSSARSMRRYVALWALRRCTSRLVSELVFAFPELEDVYRRTSLPSHWGAVDVSFNSVILHGQYCASQERRFPATNNKQQQTKRSGKRQTVATAQTQEAALITAASSGSSSGAGRTQRRPRVPSSRVCYTRCLPSRARRRIVAPSSGTVA